MSDYYLATNDSTTTGTVSTAIWGDWSNEHTRIYTRNTIYQTWLTISTTSTASTSGTVWHGWNESGTATSGSTIQLWTRWNDEWVEVNAAQEPTEESREHDRIHRLPVERVLTPEEIRVRDSLVISANERQAAWQRESAERQKAVERAKQLLMKCLSDEQRADYLAHGHFVVHGRSGKRYRIRQARSGNVDVVDRSGIILHRLCVHPADACPDPDTMLVQKLMLEADEANFLRVANPHPHYGERTPILLPH